MRRSRLRSGVCKICGEPEKTKKQGTLRRLSIDHDHRTGKVRGLLCYYCNLGLGKFKDNPELLMKAYLYYKTKDLES